MKSFTHELIVCAALVVAFVLPVAARAEENRGHHRSGISGQVVGLPTFVHQCHIRIISSDGGKVDGDIITDLELGFEVSLKPGVYTLVPYVVNTPPLFMVPGSPVVVRVEKKEIKDITLVYLPRPQ